MDDTDSASSDLDREKWRTEVDFRRREIELKEREQANRDAEIEIKRKDQASSTWRSPLIVAIFATAVAAAGNAVVTVVNGHLQRDLDARKRDAEIQLEKSKSESSRILEMIKTGETEKAAGNLEFLLKSGLVTDPELTAKLNDFLQKRMPGSGPSLPSPTGRVGFEESRPLTPTMQESLQHLLDNYFAYLDKAGFPPAAKKVMVKIENTQNANAYYQNDRIVIDPRMADDPSVPLREYNHHLLTENRRQAWRGQYSAIESGLADYFACSFLNNPRLGEKAAKLVDQNSSYIRILSNTRNFDEFATLEVGQMPYAGAEVWGGLFWEIREKLGRDVADSLMASAWLKYAIPSQESIQAREFVKVLLIEARSKGQAQFDTAQAILQARRFPIP